MARAKEYLRAWHDLIADIKVALATEILWTNAQRLQMEKEEEVQTKRAQYIRELRGYRTEGISLCIYLLDLDWRLICDDYHPAKRPPPPCLNPRYDPNFQAG
jgi:hypothetical protein